MSHSLHLVICSQLYVYGGGCETWADYFLRALPDTQLYSKIYIYHVTPQDYKKSIVKDLEIRGKYDFISLNVGEPVKGTGFRNIVYYTKFTIQQIIQRMVDGDDVILVGSTYVAPVGIMLKILARKQFNLITWIRSISVQELSSRNSKFVRVANLLEKTLLRISDYIITNGIDTLEYYKAMYPSLQDKMQVIPNGVVTSNFTDLPITDFSQRPLKIAYMGRLAEAKGFPEYRKSIKGFFAEPCGTQGVEFHVYGHGEQEHFIGQNIFYHGAYFATDVKRILAEHHAIVFLNKSHIAGGLSHGILEVMAAGRLIIAWCNMVHCQVLNSENSILIPEGDIESLVQVYQQLAKQEIDTVGLSTKCHRARLDAEKYTVKNHILRYTKVIHQLKKR